QPRLEVRARAVLVERRERLRERLLHQVPASDGLRVIRSAAEYSWSRYCRASCSNRAARAASLSACGARLVSSVSVASTGTSVPSTGVVPDVIAGLPETSLPEIRSVINNEPSPPFV